MATRDNSSRVALFPSVIDSAVGLLLPDLQEDESADDNRDEHDSDDYFRDHALCLLSQIPTFLRRDDRRGNKPAEKKQNTAAECRKLPPVAIHA